MVAILGSCSARELLGYLAELEDRLTGGGQGGGGKIHDVEVEVHVLRKWLERHGQVPRLLLAHWSVLHTDGAEAYRKLHRTKGIELYRPFGYGHIVWQSWASSCRWGWFLMKVL